MMGRQDLWRLLELLVGLALLHGAPALGREQLSAYLVSTGNFSINGTASTPRILHVVHATKSPPLEVADGASVVLRDLVLIDEAPIQGWPAESLSVALGLSSIVSLAPGGSMVVDHVVLWTSCGALINLTSLACTTTSTSELSNMQVLPDRVFVPSWKTAQLDITSLYIACSRNNASWGTISSYSAFSNYTLYDASKDPAVIDPQPTSGILCAVDRVSSWYQLYNATMAYQQVAQTVNIVLTEDVNLPSDFTAAANGTMPVYRDIRVAALPGMTKPRHMSLTIQRGEGLWTIGNTNASLTYDGITFVSLPLGPIDKFPLSAYPWGMWNVAMDRCRPISGAVVLRNCTVITNTETMDYISHWAAEALSPFPDLRAAAAWYSIDTTCTPYYNRTLLSSQVEYLDQFTWVAKNASTLGVYLLDSIITDKLPAGDTTFRPIGLQLTKLLDSPYTPFPEITWINNASQLVAALVAQSSPNIVVLGNISIPPSLWPKDPIMLTQNMVIAGWPSRATVLDWQGVTNVINLNSSTLEFRNMVLLNGGQGHYGSHPCWALNLTMYQWPLIYDRQNSLLQLQNAVIVVPPSEYSALLEGAGIPESAVDTVLMNSTAVTAPLVSGLAWLQSATVHMDWATTSLMVTDGITGNNFTITTTAIAFPAIPMNVVTSFTHSSSPTSMQTTQGKLKARQIVEIVVPAVVGFLAIISGLGVLINVHSRRQRLADIAKSIADPEHGLPNSTGSGLGPLGGPHGSIGGFPYTPPGHAAVVQSISSASSRSIHDHISLAHSHAGLLSVMSGSRAGLGQVDMFPLQLASTSASRNPPSGGLPSSMGRAPISGGFPHYGPGTPGQTSGSLMDSERGGFMDSFDRAPADKEQLLINRMEMSRELQATISEPDVAAQLKAMVQRMQDELGDQEVYITRVIGQGGGGVVYQGSWRGLTVAVKTLTFTVLPMQPMSRRQHRAMTEAAICRTLQHPNIVATYAYDLQTLQSTRPHNKPLVYPSSSSGSGSAERSVVDSGLQLRAAGPDPPPMIESVTCATEFKLCIIQEYCDGGTLKAAIDDGKLHDVSVVTTRPVMAHILQLAIDIASGMSHVHSRNIVHGDLTPANVLLKISNTSDSRFVAKVADFGLSWKLSSGQEHISNARQGTGFYISPEVLHVGIMSKAADVFSFGMLLHEMYHGTPIWRRHGVGMAAAAAVATQRPGLDQLQWSPECPASFKELICSCLSSDPQARPSFPSVVEKLLAMKRELEQAAASVSLGPGPVASCNVGRWPGSFLPTELPPIPCSEGSDGGPGSNRSSGWQRPEGASAVQAQQQQQHGGASGWQPALATLLSQPGGVGEGLAILGGVTASGGAAGPSRSPGEHQERARVSAGSNARLSLAQCLSRGTGTSACGPSSDFAAGDRASPAAEEAPALTSISGQLGDPPHLHLPPSCYGSPGSGRLQLDSGVDLDPGPLGTFLTDRLGIEPEAADRAEEHGQERVWLSGSNGPVASADDVMMAAARAAAGGSEGLQRELELRPGEHGGERSEPAVLFFSQSVNASSSETCAAADAALTVAAEEACGGGDGAREGEGQGQQEGERACGKGAAPEPPCKHQLGSSVQAIGGSLGKP